METLIVLILDNNFIQGVIKVNGACHCEAFFAEAIPY
jgi:hypothetical protein